MSRSFLAALAVLSACEAGGPAAPGADDTPRPDDTDVVVDGEDSAVDTPMGTGDTGTPIPVTPPPPEAMWAAGSRLQVEVFRHEGLDVFARFHDGLLDVPCEPALAEDGVLRCLPPSAEARIRYADAACTERVLEVAPDACETGPFQRLVTPDVAVCGQRERVSVVGMLPISTPSPIYDVEPVCGVGMPGPDGSVAYQVQPLLSAPLPPTDFVAFTESPRFGPRGVGVRVLEGDDGSWVTAGMVDVLGGCAAERVGSGLGIRCLPEERALRPQSQVYGDNGCSGEPLARDEREVECSSPRVVLSFEAFPRRVDVLEAIGRWTGPVYVASQECQPIANDGAWVQAGASVGAESFPELVIDGATDPVLSRRRYRDLDGTPLGVDVDAPFELRTTEVACRPVVTTAGSWVCLPVDALQLFAGAVWYGDATCETLVFEVGDSDADVGFVRAPRACSVEEIDRVLAVGDTYTFGDPFEGTLYQRVGDVCLSVLATQRRQRWRTGSLIEADEAYVPLERVRL